MITTDTTMIERLKQFVESEMRSCSMDIGGITPLYVYRMWGRKSTRLLSLSMELIESDDRDFDINGNTSLCLLGAWRCCGFDGKVCNRCCGGRRI